MQFTKYEKYRHRNCLDMDIVIVAIKYLGERYVRYRVAFVSQVDEKQVYAMDEIKIRHEHVENWKCVSRGEAS